MNVEVKAGPAATPEMEMSVPVINRVGIIGAGQMGNGIAHVSALAGLPVAMMDVKPEALDKAVAAAAAGTEATIQMQARKGRASYLGERSIGHQDAGATSTLLLTALRDRARL